jgi:AraC-like DNA-binding protein
MHDTMKISTADALLTNALREVDMRILEQLFDHMADTAFFIKDPLGRYLAVNDSLVERHGLREKSQLLGHRPCDVCPGDFGRIPAEQDADVLSSGRPIIERLELQWYLPQKPVWCLTTKLPLHDSTGKVSGIIGISKDVRLPIPAKEIPAGVAAALGRLETSYTDPLTPAELASIAGLPAARFARLTKRIYGISPLQLITKTRIAAASRLLRETDKQVAEIALECGFYDHSAFTRAFRGVTCVTPTQFRAGQCQG